MTSPRYVLTRELTKGSGLITPDGISHSSTLWLGTDDATGSAVVIKAYASESLRALYENERDVHIAMSGCARLAEILGHDDEHMRIVKRFIPGVVCHRGRAMRVDRVRSAECQLPRYSRERVRQLLADILECVAHAQVIGRVADHALGGLLGSVGTRGAAEPNVVIGDAGAIVVDVCSAPVGTWRADDIRNSTALRALWLYLGSNDRIPALAVADPVVADASGLPPEWFAGLRLHTLAKIDRELHDTITRHGDPVAMHHAVAALAVNTSEPLSRQERRRLERGR